MVDNETKAFYGVLKVLMWLFIIGAILTTISMIMALVTQEVTVLNYVVKCIDNIVSSLLWAFICTRITITKNEDKNNE